MTITYEKREKYTYFIIHNIKSAHFRNNNTFRKLLYPTYTWLKIHLRVQDTIIIYTFSIHCDLTCSTTV